MPQKNKYVFELPHLGIQMLDSSEFRAIPLSEYASFHPHNHPYYELHIIEKGSLILYADDAFYTLESGQFCLISPGVLHTPRSNVFQTYRACLSFELIKKAMPVSSWLAEHSRCRPVCYGTNEALVHLFQALCKEHRSGNSFSDERTSTLLSMLLLELIRSIETLPPAPPGDQNDLDQSRSLLIDNFLYSNYNLSAGDALLAKQLCVSRRQLDRILKKLYGKGYRERISEIRIHIACDLLLLSNDSIRSISEQVGYSTPANFTAFFRNAMGMTPSEYRRKYR